MDSNINLKCWQCHNAKTIDDISAEDYTNVHKIVSVTVIYWHSTCTHGNKL